MAWPVFYEAMSSQLKKHKVVFLGPQGAGKTSLVVRFMYDSFDPNYMGTIGIDFMSHVSMVEGVPVRMQIWDTAGQERFRALVPTYIRGSQAVFMVYDVTREPPEVEAEIKRWHNMVNMEGDSPCIALIANKMDRDDIRKIDTSLGRKWAEEFGAEYFETSAKTGHNVAAMFRRVAEKLIAPCSGDKDTHCAHNVILRPLSPEGESKAGCKCLS